jgi:hypothetical protein
MTSVNARPFKKEEFRDARHLAEFLFFVCTDQAYFGFEVIKGFVVGVPISGLEKMEQLVHVVNRSPRGIRGCRAARSEVKILAAG